MEIETRGQFTGFAVDIYLEADAWGFDPDVVQDQVELSEYAKLLRQHLAGCWPGAVVDVTPGWAEARTAITFDDEARPDVNSDTYAALREEIDADLQTAQDEAWSQFAHGKRATA